MMVNRYALMSAAFVALPTVAHADVVDVYKRTAVYDIYMGATTLPTIPSDSYSGPTNSGPAYDNAYSLKKAGLGSLPGSSISTFQTGDVVGPATLTGNTLDFMVKSGPAGGTYGFTQLTPVGTSLTTGVANSSNIVYTSGYNGYSGYVFLGGGAGGPNVATGGQFSTAIVLHGVDTNGPSWGNIGGDDCSTTVTTNCFSTPGWVYDTTADTSTLKLTYLGDYPKDSAPGARIVFSLPTGFGEDTNVVYTNTLFVEPTAVPEPATWAMMGLGFAVLGFAGWRRARPAAPV